MRKALYQGKRFFSRFWRDIRLERELRKYAGAQKKRLREAREKWENVYQHEQNPLVSVTIPTYNRARILTERTVPSVLSQTYQNFEIVIVGDACTDDTEERLKKLKDPRIHFLNLPQRGKYPTDILNRHAVQGLLPQRKSLELSKGLWIAHLDDDDAFTPEHIEVLLNTAIKQNLEFVYARQHKEVSPGGRWVEIGRPGFPDGFRPFNRCCVPHRTILFRSYLNYFHFSKDIDVCWKFNLGGDILKWEHMGRAGVRAGYLDKIVALKYASIPVE